MTAALDLADGGYEVMLLEREQALGGHMAPTVNDFPDLDPALSGVSQRRRKWKHIRESVSAVIRSWRTSRGI